ncbi:MAG: flagellar biosynthetic protein FliO [Enterobacteriaceae bacterium]|jgi:flagellar protein FliO/FliZ|nr:flagellar biosynthetic protein FliO [Enterobacteriaceae bacterium]
MMANQPSLHASFQHGAVSDTAPVGTKMINTGTTTASTAITGTPSLSTSQTFSTGQTFMQVSSALGGVLLLIFFITWLTRRLGLTPAKNKHHRLLNVKASCSLGPKERIVVVEVEESWLVLGVTAQHINLLHQLPAPSDEAEKEAVMKTLPFGQLLKNKLQQLNPTKTMPAQSNNDRDGDEK